MGHLQILRCDYPYKIEIESGREKNSVRDGGESERERERGRQWERDGEGKDIAQGSDNEGDKEKKLRKLDEIPTEMQK